MNNKAFKVIFSKRLGKHVVVSEITTSDGKTAKDSISSRYGSIKSFGEVHSVTGGIRLAVVSVLGVMQVVNPMLANAQVVADGNAPANQRPIILNTASGATQINVRTPSAAGVSINQYSRFDINNPTILNNSRTNVNTQTAGMVQGNPFLATGSARVIVNQVNGNLARINNSIEIAGSRAELVIAAPAGIMVNGGSIINASRTTLTTGAPIINGGNLEGYRVTQGQISVDGQGLDTTGSDYTDILARSVQANAGIWAKNLNIVTGANQIDLNNNAAAIAGEGATPAYALDSSALGGMYANKITFIGTEKGLGINNAGQIAAAAGSVTISNDGILTNSGTISSNGQENATTINTTAVRNSGTISAQGNTQIQTSAELQNSGTVTSGRELNVKSQTTDNSNGVLNGQRLDITTSSLNNTKGKIQQTGFTQALALNAGSINNVNNGVIGYAPIDSTGGGSSGGSSGGSGSGSSGSGTTPSTPTTAAGGGTSTVVQPAPLPTLTDGVINVTGNINNDAGQITANGGIDLTSNNGLTNHATLNLNKLTVSGNSLDNSSGTITTTQLTANTNSINNTSGKLGSSGNINLTAQTLTNSGGQITSSGSLAANIAQTVLNDNGVLASTNALTLNSGSLNNTNGTISANTANADVTSAGGIDNTKGTIQAATALNVTGNGLNNTDGKINGATTIVNAQTAALNNTRGSIAGDNLTITSGALTNDAGLIQGSKALAINTQGQTLTNINSGTANGIVSGGTLKVQSGNLNNNTGSISSNADTTINAANITSQSGSITSLGNATITGTGFDNQGGQVQSIGNTSILVGGGTVNNNNGLIRTDGDTTVNAANVINTNTNGTDKGIEGTNVTLNANNVDNTSGAIRADETLSIIGTGTVNNTSGLITSSKAVVIKDSNAATNPSAKTQTVINTNGTISAGQSNTIDSKSLTGDGKVTSNQDLSISINTDYANTGELTADGKLTLNTTGNINNTSKISAGSDLNVSAQNIDNAANAEINGNTTSIHANDTLTNRGLIDGGATVVTAGNTINNIGTGRIYGNNLSVGTTTLNNIDETINGVNKAATIAAREDLDIGAQTINNIEHSSLISLGDMRIGGALDSNHNATGKAGVINNNSATIESTENMAINVGQLNNRNMHFATGQVVVGTEQRYYYRPSVASPVFYDESQTEIRNLDTNAVVTNPNLTVGKDRLYSPTGVDYEWYYRDVIAETTRSTVTESDPGKIISGQTMTISLDNGLNDKSQIIAGGALTISGGTITNEQATGTQQTIERGKVVHTNVSNGGNGSRSFDTVDANYVNAYNPTTITLDGIAVQQQNVNAGSGNTVAAHGSNAAGGAAGAGQANAINEVHATDTTDPTMIRTADVNTSIPNSSLFSVNPNGNGYLIATDPRFTDASKWLSSDFMLKALNLDPANIHKRLGDGYYEQKLVKEQIAQLTGRRYLDGQSNDDEQYKALMNAGITFANQYNLRPGIALTPEQMARLTSDIVWLVEQTVTLPDGTKTTALVPQVYVRTRPGDITGSGALISGDSVKLNLTGDLNNKGNIAGRTVVKIDANNINNLNGRIHGDVVDIHANTDFNNIGGIVDAQTQARILAERDVNVISTTSTATTNGKRSSSSNTGIDRIAGIYVGDGYQKLTATDTTETAQKPVTLFISAGRDANLIGADVVNEGDGIIAITAENNLNIDTLKVKSSNSTHKDSKNYINDSVTAEVGTNIIGSGIHLQAGNDINARQANVIALEDTLTAKAGHNLNLTVGQETATGSGSFTEKEGKKKSSYSGNSTVSTDIGSNFSGQGVNLQAGNDFTATAANVNAGFGALNVIAGHDITIQEGRETYEKNIHSDSSKKGFLSKKSSTADSHIDSDTSISSNMIGGKVTMIAGHDYTQTGSNVVGIGNVAIQAGNNVTIESSQDHYSESNSEETKKSGFNASFTGGIATIGYGKSKAAAQNSLDATVQNASTVASLNGNTTIKAGNQMTIAASDVSAGENLTLIAKDIDLEARQDVVDEHHAQQSKSSGFSISATLNAPKAFKDAYKRTQGESGGTTMGKIMGVADATMDVLSSNGISIGSQKSSATQNGSTSTARVSSLTAGNNLTMIATEGSIDSQGTQMSAEGDALILARDNINFDVAHNYETQDSNSKSSGWNAGINLGIIPFGMNKGKSTGDGVTDTITGTQLSVGGNATLATTKGDITLTAANIVANENVNINAARNLTVQSGQDTAANENHSDNKAIGSVRISDTERFWGYHTEKHNDNGANVTQVSSNIASLGGNVNLKAGEKYTQTASNVMAANDINVTAKSIELLTADNTGVHHDDDKSLKVGVFARVTSPLIDLVNNVDAARKSDDRLAAMQGMAAGANLYQAGSAAIGALTNGAMGSGTLAKAEVGVGVASAKSRNDSQYQISQGSAISAGGNLNLTSTEGDIHGVQATLAAGKTLTLDSANNILLEAGESHTESSGKNSNWGVEVGVGVQVGAQTGAYVYATANVGKGKYETSSTTYSNTHLTGETINIKSKGDTTLKGADATANTINADVGGKLTIESLQDTAEQHAEQSNIGGRVQVSLGSAWEASGSISAANANGTYNGVNQQSGLFAKDGGYNVKADTVDLKGGAITSTNAANSELTANAITFSNLENKMEYEADSATISGGIGGSGGPSITPGLPMSESGSDSSTTRATLTEGKITIGGQSTSAAATGINTDAAAAHNTIDKLPDLQVLLKDQQAMAAAASTVISTVKQASSDVAKEAERQKADLKTVAENDIKSKGDAAWAAYENAKPDARESMLRDANSNYADASQAAINWGKGGDYSRALDVVTGIIVGGVAGQGGTQVAANAAAPFAAEAIGNYFDEHPNQTMQILSHAVLGAALAYANGSSVAGGAAAGAAGEAAAQYLTKELYPEAYADGKLDPTKLNQEQKENIIALSTAVGALVGGAAGGSVYDAAVGGNIAENAATNNELDITNTMSIPELDMGNLLCKFALWKCSNETYATTAENVVNKVPVPVAVNVNGSAFGTAAAVTLNAYNGQLLGTIGGTTDTVPSGGTSMIFIPYGNVRYGNSGANVSNILQGTGVGGSTNIGPVNVGANHSFGSYTNGQYNGAASYSMGLSVGPKSIKTPFKSSITTDVTTPLTKPLW